MKVLGDFDLDFSKLQDVLIDSYAAFPNPAKAGMLARLTTDNTLYFCSTIDASGAPVWVPLSNQYQYTVFTQSTASNQWYIYHTWYALASSKAIRVYTTSGVEVTPTFIDLSNPDYALVSLPTSMIGTAIILNQDGIDGGIAKYVKLTAAGNIAATNVQDAIYELDTEKVNTSDVVTTAAANKILKLDASGNLPTSVTGNAATATKLATARTITLSGSVSGSASFDGSGNVTITTSGGGGSATPAGSSTQIQYNGAGAFAGATYVTIDNNDLTILENTAPVTPTAGVKLFAKKLANRMMLASVGPSGLDAVLQPSLWRQKVAIWMPPGNATTAPGVFGISAPTAVGTATSRSVATTNLLTRTRRIGYVSSTSVGQFAGIYSSNAQYTTGDGTGLGGFFYAMRFAITDAAAVAGARTFVGMSSSTSAPTNVEPNTLTNSIGVAQLSTDSTQLYIVYGGSTAQTAIALGTNFPPMNGTGATNGIAYDLTLFAPPSSNGVVHYRLERLGTTFVASGTLTPTTVGTQTPASSTLMAMRAWRGNNATALAVGLDILGFYIETDY
jgi:hypothetical protein